jgi:hypothetical protein
LFSIKARANCCSILSKNLSPEHYYLDKYENKLGYGKNEYVVLYGNTKVWLVDMNGKDLNEWDSPIKRALLLKNCNLLVIDTNQNNFVSEKNNSGEIIWHYEAPGITHHDLELTDDGLMTFFTEEN